MAFVSLALVVVVAMCAGVVWWTRPPQGLFGVGVHRAPKALLPIPDHPSGPPAGSFTGAGVGGEAIGKPARFVAVRTAGDDTQLVVYMLEPESCGTPRVTGLTMNPNVVTVSIQAVNDVEICVAAFSSGAFPIGVALPEPLHGRQVSDGTETFTVIDGARLARIALPGTDGRPVGESITGPPDPLAKVGVPTSLKMTGPTDPFVWSQTGTAPPIPPSTNERCDGVVCSETPGTWSEKAMLATEPLQLIQTHPAPTSPGTSPADLCAKGPPATTATTSSPPAIEPVDLNGAQANLVRCANGRLALQWHHDGDEMVLDAPDPAMLNVDAAKLETLARSVQFGQQ